MFNRNTHPACSVMRRRTDQGRLRYLARFGATLAFGILLAGCGGSGSSGPGSPGTGSSGAGAPAAGPASGQDRQLGYYTHTKAIIDSRCVTCHRDGGQAPFPLTDYAEVAAKRSAMIYALESGTMPIPGFAPLSVQERELLLQWLEQGAAKGRSPEGGQTTPYTYYGQAKAIIEAKCAGCHRPGENAPFSLTDYDSVYAVRAAVAHQVASGAMPPWPPTNHFLPLQDNRSLADEDKAILNSWLAGGAPAGNPGDYSPAPQNPAGIDYNLTISMNEPYTPTVQPDDYRCLMIDWPLDHTVFVDAVNVIPDARAQVHHAFAVIIDPENLAPFEAADGADGKPGFPCWGAPSPQGTLLPPRALSVWAPGVTAGYLPAGTGVRVAPGSRIVMQMHYNTTNSEPVADQSGLEIHYVDAVDREALTLFFLDVRWPGPGGMPIPAGDPSVTFTHTSDVGWAMAFVGADKVGISPEEPFALHSVYLHQHVLGRSNSIELIREDGTEIMLVDIRDWDFDWQDEYTFDKEIIVQPGDKFRLTCNWDNSASNQQFVDGKQLEPRYVEFGEGTFDEMCVSYFYVTRVREEDRGTLQDILPTVGFRQPQYLQVFHPGDYLPVELLVNAFSLQEPDSSHADHGHTDVVEGVDTGPTHDHRAGHYHLYLDTDDDNAAHSLGWDAATYYQLPEDIAPGRHTLRVSLRDDMHEATGVESRVTFVVEADPGAGRPAAVESLVDVEDWQSQDATTDSLAGHRPDTVSCPENAWYEEDGVLEVETGYCNYLSLRQPSKAGVSKGDNIHLVLWHGQLRFDEPAEAHVAVSIGGKVIWELETGIPDAGAVYDVTIPSTITAPPGEMVEFHLHNHGYNSWTLLTLEVRH